MTLAELASARAGLRLRDLCWTGVGVKATELIVAQPSAVTGIARLVAKAPLRVLKDQLLVRSLDQLFGAVLPKAFDKESLRLLRHHAVRHAGAGSALEARR